MVLVEMDVERDDADQDHYHVVIQTGMRSENAIQGRPSEETGKPKGSDAGSAMVSGYAD